MQDGGPGVRHQDPLYQSHIGPQTLERGGQIHGQTCPDVHMRPKSDRSGSHVLSSYSRPPRTLIVSREYASYYFLPEVATSPGGHLNTQNRVCTCQSGECELGHFNGALLSWEGQRGISMGAVMANSIKSVLHTGPKTHHRPSPKFCITAISPAFVGCSNPPCASLGVHSWSREGSSRPT